VNRRNEAAAPFPTHRKKKKLDWSFLRKHKQTSRTKTKTNPMKNEISKKKQSQKQMEIPHTWKGSSMYMGT